VCCDAKSLVKTASNIPIHIRIKTPIKSAITIPIKTAIKIPTKIHIKTSRTSLMACSVVLSLFFNSRGAFRSAFRLRSGMRNNNNNNTMIMRMTNKMIMIMKRS
jgi:hypothetical protein